MFTLHPQLAADCTPVADLTLCRVLLMDDARFPWLILVPMREGLSEVFELDDAARITLMEETTRVSRALHLLLRADKINIASLGNQVPQLHVHVIARRKGDAAWPNPVWSATTPRTPYTAAEKQRLTGQIRDALR